MHWYIVLWSVVSIFITLYNYSSILLSIFIILCIRSLWLAYISLQVCTLSSINFIPHATPIATILLYFLQVWIFFNLQVSEIIQYSSYSVWLVSLRINMLRVHPWCHKWQDSLLSHRWIIFCCQMGSLVEHKLDEKGLHITHKCGPCDCTLAFRWSAVPPSQVL